MKWISTISEQADLKQAVQSTVEQIQPFFGGEKPDLLLAFVSPHHQSKWGDLPRELDDHFPGALLLGSSGGGVIGGGREIERSPAFSLSAASLPGVKLTPLRLENEDLPPLKSDRKSWEKIIGLPFDQNPQFILLPDPFTFEIQFLLEGLDFAYPWSKKIGGMVSGGNSPEGHILYAGPEAFHSGLAGVALNGNLAIDTIVAQGCRPIGVPMFVTQCQGNLLQELDGRPPSVILQELYPALEPRDQELFRNSLFLGMVMKESRQNYGRGDFLIRNIVGMDRETGALSIGAALQENWVVQFHLRDAQASADDLEDLLSRYAGDLPQPSPQGALLFSCLGRGVHLYGEPDHDTRLFHRHLPGVSVGGFFCNGEIGPVQGKTYLHGYTSSFGIFRPRS